VPRQRNIREENGRTRAGDMPAQWQQPAKKWKLRHKGADARSTKKSHQNQYNFKNHLNADKVSNAAVHDSQMFETLLDQTENKGGNKRPT